MHQDLRSVPQLIYFSTINIIFTMQVLDDFAQSDLDKLERLADNFKWFILEYDSIKKEFKRQYVAIREKQIVDSDTNLERLIKRLNIKNYDKSIAIEYIYN
ncbi:hypothetical protein BH23THE1_BH23THE1_23210 [soil metagenome]